MTDLIVTLLIGALATVTVWLILREMRRDLESTAREWPSSPPVERKFEPLHEVTMYQARCTNCGTVEDDYGDWSAWSDPSTPVEQVCENGWFERTRYEAAPTEDCPNRRIVHTEELLCPDCQRCEVCGSERAYEHDDHLVCDEHEDHDFAAAAS